MGLPCRRTSASRWRSMEKSRTPHGTLLRYHASAPMSANTVVAKPTAVVRRGGLRVRVLERELMGSRRQRRLECEELVELACARTGLLGDEHAPFTQHSADLVGHERFVPADNQSNAASRKASRPRERGSPDRRCRSHLRLVLLQCREVRVDLRRGERSVASSRWQQCEQPCADCSATHRPPYPCRAWMPLGPPRLRRSVQTTTAVARGPDDRQAPRSPSRETGSQEPPEVPDRPTRMPSTQS